MKKKTKIWVLTSYNLTTKDQLCVDSSIYSNVNFIKCFSKKKYAIKFAEDDYAGTMRPIAWKKVQGILFTTDLEYVKYNITRLQVEK